MEGNFVGELYFANYIFYFTNPDQVYGDSKALFTRD